MRVFRRCSDCGVEWSRVETGLIYDQDRWHKDVSVCFECFQKRQVEEARDELASAAADLKVKL
jgi:hypothetical protein